MTVLKSFELKGNKQSFASWISNQSPCESPFTSMIGKEQVDETQYSWQTDSLAGVRKDAWEEGSDVEFPARGVTTEMTNFTQTLRKVISISDTVSKLGLEAKKKELEYQMAKAGKEMKRDLEFMNLNNNHGNPGLPDLASKFYGFEGLVAPYGAPDPDTNAIVHHQIDVINPEGAWFTMDALNAVTMNLYLSGSKADKIMYHPRHSCMFSDLLGNCKETPLVYRMFDGLDDRMNLKVAKIRDNLGRWYTLIPNRFMPEDKIYFFNDADWTQTILRQPTSTKLGKKGSSEQYMIEMEVGLRHKSMFASGILSMNLKPISNVFAPSRTVFTGGVGDALASHALIKQEGKVLQGVTVQWRSSNPEVIGFSASSSNTNSQGRANIQIQAGNTAGHAVIWSEYLGFRSTLIPVEVRAPVITLTGNNPTPAVNEKVVFEVEVAKWDDSPITKVQKVQWKATPGSVLELDSIETETTAAGVAGQIGTVLKTDACELQVTMNGFKSNTLGLNKVVDVGNIVLTATPNPVPEGSTTTVSAYVTDRSGSPIIDRLVTFKTDMPGQGDIPASARTDNHGYADVNFTPLSNSDYVLEATVGNLSTTEVLKVGAAVVAGSTLELTLSEPSIKTGSVSVATIRAADAAGKPLEGLSIQFQIDPTWTSGRIPELITGIDGSIQYGFRPVVSGVFKIKACVLGISPAMESQEVTLTVTDPITDFDTPYSHTVSGHGVTGTHSIGKHEVVTVKSMLWGEPARGIRMHVESLTPDIASVSDLGVATDFDGNYVVHVHGKKAGTALMRARAQNNQGNWIEFSMKIGSPVLSVIVSHTSQVIGRDVEFAAVLRDANDNWAPGARIRWEYPAQMLANGTTLPVAETDQFGRLLFTRKLGTFGPHTFRAILESDDTVRSRDHYISGYIAK